MALRDGLHRFLDIIGIVRSDEPDEPAQDGRYGRERTGDEGRDFADREGDYDPPRVTRLGRDAQDSYRGYSRTESQYQSTPEVDNMVEFKNIRQQSAAQPTDGRTQHTVIHYLRDISDCKDIIDDLLEENQVVLNIEDTDDSIKQRAIDMIYGASYALGAKMRRASRDTYIIAPSGVMINDTDEDDARRQSSGYASNIRGFRS